MENVTQRWTQLIRAFLPKSEYFYDFPVSVDKYALMSLNIPKYP